MMASVRAHRACVRAGGRAHALLNRRRITPGKVCIDLDRQCLQYRAAILEERGSRT